MNQKDRMLAGLPYKAWMDGLSQERLENKKKIFAFNHLDPDRLEEKEKLLKEILGKIYSSDKKIKSGDMDSRIALELLIGEL